MQRRTCNWFEMFGKVLQILLTIDCESCVRNPDGGKQNGTIFKRISCFSRQLIFASVGPDSDCGR